MDESQNPNSGGDSTNAVDDLKSGPFSLLYDAVKNNVQILINVRNNHKYIARVKAYDRHMNLYVDTPNLKRICHLAIACIESDVTFG